jgi:hypothetical protein
MRRNSNQKVRIGIEVSVFDLADEIIAVCEHEGIIELIKSIDERVGEWDFTLQLCEHFAKLAEEQKREVAEDAAKRGAVSQ